MRLILNILWLLFGGLFSALGWVLTGCLWCITVVGIPVGNILWIIFGGIEMAIGNALIGIVLCITIIGIPWGKQYFKIAKLSLMPFGARVEREHIL